ncbi:hypothetical protein POL68_04130 [Stigmatella sp. ncwal1]|uniref:Uncharacterized protein n=1 Tax=Stigmatella ashevillensis TaxID=2995309 RepID=A0ABT5D3N9_9BACT|nr:hypothetical protein [Stigmatella ashevillena]MDC0707649.1 hypothetical protein [Stigmatella ashevillena]
MHHLAGWRPGRVPRRGPRHALTRGLPAGTHRRASLPAGKHRQRPASRGRPRPRRAAPAAPGAALARLGGSHPTSARPGGRDCHRRPCRGPRRAEALRAGTQGPRAPAPGLGSWPVAPDLRPRVRSRRPPGREGAPEHEDRPALRQGSQPQCPACPGRGTGADTAPGALRAVRRGGTPALRAARRRAARPGGIESARGLGVAQAARGRLQHLPALRGPGRAGTPGPRGRGSGQGRHVRIRARTPEGPGPGPGRARRSRPVRPHLPVATVHQREAGAARGLEPLRRARVGLARLARGGTGRRRGGRAGRQHPRKAPGQGRGGYPHQGFGGSLRRGEAGAAPGAGRDRRLSGRGGGGAKSVP